MNITIAYKFEEYLRTQNVKKITTILNWAPIGFDKKSRLIFQLNKLDDEYYCFPELLVKNIQLEILFNISKTCPVSIF